MSMRTYGVQTKGMVITLNDFQVLLSLNKGTINKDLFENVDNVDFSEVIDFSLSGHRLLKILKNM